MRLLDQVTKAISPTSSVRAPVARLRSMVVRMGKALREHGSALEEDDGNAKMLDDMQVCRTSYSHPQSKG